MTDEKFVWIVVPVFERVNHIFNLIQCLEEQTYTNYKLIIVDHGNKKRRAHPDVRLPAGSERLQTPGAARAALLG